MTRHATLTADTHAIGPSGQGITIPAGTYEVADLDGVPEGVLYLCDRVARGVLIGCVQERHVTVKECR